MRLASIVFPAILIFLGLGFAAQIVSAQAQYNYQTIDDANAAPPGSGVPAGTQAHGINNTGTIVGVYTGAATLFTPSGAKTAISPQTILTRPVPSVAALKRMPLTVPARSWAM